MIEMAPEGFNAAWNCDEHYSARPTIVVAKLLHILQGFDGGLSTYTHKYRPNSPGGDFIT